jgi:hypothetical protein
MFTQRSWRRHEGAAQAVPWRRQSQPAWQLNFHPAVCLLALRLGVSQVDPTNDIESQAKIRRLNHLDNHT